MEDNQLTMRDQFAMQAISSILTTQRIPSRGDSNSVQRQEETLMDLAVSAYRLADAMLLARTKKLEP